MTMIAVKRGTKIVSGPQLRTVSLFSTLGELERAGGSYWCYRKSVLQL
jgi:hypothetical protein